MSRKVKYPHLISLYTTDRNAYFREWRKLNPDLYEAKDPRKKIIQNIFDELPNDVIPVDDFPTYYVRSNGEVWRDTRDVPSAIRTGKARVLRLTPTFNKHNGYWIVQPYVDGKKKAIHLHRFILTALKGPAPDPTMECHHIDANTSNNCIDNLMWVTRQQNQDFVPNYKRKGPKKTLATGRKESNSRWSSYYPQILELLNLGLRPVDIATKLDIPRGSIYMMVQSIKKRGKL